MKITAKTLFLAVATFLDSVELISSKEPEEMSLAQLFPGYMESGRLPPIRKFPYEESKTHKAFKQIGSNHLVLPNGPVLARENVVFAWTGTDPFHREPRGHYLEPLCKLFSWYTGNKGWVFETTNYHWVSLNENELKRMGIGYHMDLVEAQRLMAFITKEKTNREDVDERAHTYAYELANHKVDIFQADQAEKIRRSKITVAQGDKAIQKRYEQEYKIAFAWYVNNLGKHFGYNQPSSSSNQQRH